MSGITRHAGMRSMTLSGSGMTIANDIGNATANTSSRMLLPAGISYHRHKWRATYHRQNGRHNVGGIPLRGIECRINRSDACARQLLHIASEIERIETCAL